MQRSQCKVSWLGSVGLLAEVMATSRALAGRIFADRGEAASAAWLHTTSSAESTNDAGYICSTTLSSILLTLCSA